MAVDLRRYNLRMNTWIYLAALALAVPAFADQAVVFRCTNADGKVALQDGPCPSGSTQVIQRRGASSVSTASTSLGEEKPNAVLDSDLLPALQDGQQATEGGAILDSDVVRARAAAQAGTAPPKPPLPDIYRCVGRDDSQYLHEFEPAPPRCVPLALTGLGGSVAPGNAASCEVQRDTYTALDEEQRCGGWQQRLRTARGQERFAAPDNQAAATAERERLQAVLEASDCPVP